MDLELYDCRHCNTFGLLPTSDGKCPHCQSDLTAEDKQGSHPPGWAPCPTRPATEQDRTHKTLRNVIALCVIIPGVVVLLASPLTCMISISEHLERTGNALSLSGAVVRSVVPAATARSLRLLLIGWILTESGLLIAAPRLALQVLLRIPLYLLIFATLAILSLLFLFSHMGP
jgi:hypothetical protein